MRFKAVFAGVAMLTLLLGGAVFYSGAPPTVRAEDDHSDFRGRATQLEIGARSIPGNIEEKGIVDRDYFKFQTQRGVKYIFSLNLVSLSDADIVVINSNDRGHEKAEEQPLTREGNMKQVEWVAPTTDTYFLGVFGFKGGATGQASLLGDYTLSATADFSLNDRHGETSDDPTPLVVGSQHRGAISPWSRRPMYANSIKADYDHDYFSFEARRGARYHVSAQLDSLEGLDISVENKSGEVAATNEGAGSTLDWIAENTGIYYLALSGTDLARNPAGAYVLEVSEDLSLEDRHGSYRTGASPLSIGSRTAGAISPADDQDYFSIQAARGVKHFFDVSATAGLAAKISVLGYDGSTLATNDGVGSSLEWIARSTGARYVVVSASPLERTPVAAYVFDVSADRTLEDRHNDGTSGATQVQFGTPHTGSISPADDQDFFYFKANKGIKYEFSVDLAAEDEVSMSLFGASEKVDAPISGPGAILEWTAPQTGSYYAVFAASANSHDIVGHYSVNVTADASLVDQHSDQRAGATSLTMGIAQQGSINPEGDRDYFSFSANRGVEYGITVDPGSAAGLQLEVVGADNRAEVANDGLGNDLVWIAPSNDNYYVVVSSPGFPDNTVGRYSMVVKADTSYQDLRGETRVTATRIDLNTNIAGSISPRNDVDFFKFAGRRGVVYQVDTGPDSMVDYSIFRSDGTLEISNENQNSILSWAASSDGDYFAALSASTDENEPLRTYNLEVTGEEVTVDRHGELLRNATRIDLGSRIPGAISPADDIDRLFFTATKGVQYTFDLTYGTAETVSLSVSESRESNVVLASNYGQDASVKWLSPANKEYVVTITGAPQLADPVGTYYLRVTADAGLIDRHSSQLAGATAVGIGITLTGAISPAEDTDVFVFNGEQGSNYLVRVRSLTGETARISVTNPESSYSESNYGALDTVLVTAPTSGKYYVVVSGGAERGGDATRYEVTVNPDQFAPSIAADPAQTNRINAAASEFSLSVDSRVAPPGASVRAPIFLTDAEGITGLAFSLLYDPEVIEFIGVERGSLLASADFDFGVQHSGSVRFGFSSSQPISGAGSAAVAVFRAVGSMDSSSPLVLSLGLAANSDGRSLPIAVSDGEISVGDRVMGDGNGDGVVSALDALIASKIANGLSEMDLALDLDGDGAVTGDDARNILVMAGLGREV